MAGNENNVNTNFQTGGQVQPGTATSTQPQHPMQVIPTGPTQSAPASPPTGQQGQQAKPNKKKGGGMFAILAVIVILAGIGVWYFVFSGHAVHTINVTIMPTTTVAQIQVSKISGCRTVDTSGTYYLSQNIQTNIGSGACIDIKSSNVKIIGNGNNVTGSGPYVATPPYTYGVLIENATNVTVTGIGVSKFSYGIYATGTVYSAITNSRVENGTISGIYLIDSYHNTIENNSVTGVASKGGGIALQRGGNNSVLNNIIQHNAYYGLVINSSGNTFAEDKFLNNPVDTQCVGVNGASQANKFIGSECSVNNYCNFVSCNTTNKPYVLNTMVLSKQVNSCGWIVNPGVYVLQKNLSLEGYVNFSKSYAGNVSCITVSTSNVKLDCANNTIYGVGNGVSIGNASVSTYNVSVANCKFGKYYTAINATRTFDINISGTSASGGTTGILLNNDTAGSVSHVFVSNNMYGAYVNETEGISFDNFTATNNIYGTYVNGAQGNAYYYSSFKNNSNTDLACTGQSYRSTFNIFSGNKCGVTDCQWGASCSTYKEPQLSQYMLAGCGTISNPGNYSLSNGEVSSGNCITIDASNVNLNCSYFNMTGKMSGTAITVNGQSNVNIRDCNINDFARGIYASGDSKLSVENMNISRTGAPIIMMNSSYGTVSNVSASQFSSGGFRFIEVGNSTITNDTANYGQNNSAGFILNKSSDNLVLYDSAAKNSGYGFGFLSSLHNTVANNTAVSNKGSDYYCSPDSSGMYAENGGVNNGLNKTGCIWLVEVPSAGLQNQCIAINTASQITFTHDMYYTYGQTCYTIYNNAMGSGNNTVINCNGHTVYSSKGGSFVREINSSNVKIENCYLKGFSTPIVVTGFNDKVLNNMIGMANVSVSIHNAEYPRVSNNIFNNASYGVIAENSQYGYVQNNTFSDVNISTELVGSTQFLIENNTANGSGSIGLYLVNSQINSAKDNNFTSQTKAGFACTLGSENTTSLNNDLGGNRCLNRLNCNWISKSDSTCKA